MSASVPWGWRGRGDCGDPRPHPAHTHVRVEALGRTGAPSEQTDRGGLSPVVVLHFGFRTAVACGAVSSSWFCSINCCLKR